jgi:formamidopyrimidine-DNA glycosylase
MPELPEVEVVRRGVAGYACGRVVAEVLVHHPRAVRRHLAGPDDLAARLCGRRLTAARRRGKYLWLEAGAVDQPGEAGRVDAGRPARADQALVIHLGMSGQLLVEPAGSPPEPHLRVELRFADGDPDLRFVDQRTFGGMLVDELVPAPDLPDDVVPASVAHVARDLLDPAHDREAVVTVIRSRRTGLKRVLLDQRVVSGIGNIYADEALWRSRLHGDRAAASLSRPQVRRVLADATEVMTRALGQGGTSFDALYVNVNGASGYFERSLEAYGRRGQPCRRCGAPIRRDSFMNRSSYSCPRCQPAPRQR